MNIYIASSWKNQHAVEMLSGLLRHRNNVTVWSFVENNHGEHKVDGDGMKIPFEEWVWSDQGRRSFVYDTDGASKADLVIYISPSGTDAWCEVGIAWASGVPIMGLHAKGEQCGLMRRTMDWYDDYCELLKEVDRRIAKRESKALAP